MKIVAFLLMAATVVGLMGAGAESSHGERSRGPIEPSKIDAALNGLIQSKKLVGVSALVYENDREVYFGAFGAADRESGKPMTRDTLVQIFSMTKPISGVACMMLYEEGKFELDDPLEKYAPEFAHMRVYAGIDPHGEVIYEPVRRPVTLRDITRHTAGFYNGTDHTPLAEIVRAADAGSKTNTLADEAKKLGSLPLLFQPGTRWLYGPSVDVQAFLVERLSGMPFDQFLEQKIFKPLRMTHTSYASGGDRGVVAAHQRFGGLRHRLRRTRQAAGQCAGGIRSGGGIFLGWRRGHVVLGGPEEQDYRGAVHAVQAIRQGAAAQGIS